MVTNAPIAFLKLDPEATQKSFSRSLVSKSHSLSLA